MSDVLNQDNPYTKMQRGIYEGGANNWSLEAKDHVVGSFDAHNGWPDYEHLFRNIVNPENAVVLDFGCGPGRNLVKYNGRFARIDGADIAAMNLQKAALWLATNGIDVDSGTLYQTDGISVNTVPSDTYDIVMSTITFQHICVYDIRRSILTDFLRVLKRGGMITIQTGFGPAKHDGVLYFDNFYDATTTNGNMDVKVEDTDMLKADLESIGYENVSWIIGDVGPGNNHSNWIYFQAHKPL